MKFNKLIRRYHIKEVTSTSLILYENISKVSNLTFLSADYQSSGKGRGEHIWSSNAGENLLFSFVIKDKKIINEYKILSLSIASIITRYLESIKLKNVSIKWPNDIYINDKKVCGILLQGNISLGYIIVGVGLNVNQKKFDGLTATSLSNELNIPLSLKKIKRKLFSQIRRDLGFVRYFPRFLLEYAKARNYLMNKEVSYEINNKKYQGVVQGINDDASLLISNDGKIETIDCGEVFIL